MSDDFKQCGYGNKHIWIQSLSASFNKKAPAVYTMSLQKVRHLIHMSQGNPDVIWLYLNVRVIACSCMSLFFMMMVWHLNYVLYHIKLTLHVWTGDDYITPEGTVFYNGIDSCPFVCVCVCVCTSAQICTHCDSIHQSNYTSILLILHYH